MGGNCDRQTSKCLSSASNMLGSIFGSTKAGNINRRGRGLWPRCPNITISGPSRRAESLARPSRRPSSGRGAGPPMADTRPPLAVAYRFHRSDRAGQHAPEALGHTDSNWPNCRRGLPRSRMAWRPLLRQGGVCQDGGDGIRVETLKRYASRPLRTRSTDPAAREAGDQQKAANWAQNGTPTSLIFLRRALLGFETGRIRQDQSQVLYILCRTDAYVPTKIAPTSQGVGTAGRREARYFRARQRFGHSSSGLEPPTMVAGIARVPGALVAGEMIPSVACGGARRRPGRCCCFAVIEQKSSRRAGFCRGGNSAFEARDGGENSHNFAVFCPLTANKQRSDAPTRLAIVTLTALTFSNWRVQSINRGKDKPSIRLRPHFRSAVTVVSGLNQRSVWRMSSASFRISDAQELLSAGLRFDNRPLRQLASAIGSRKPHMGHKEMKRISGDGRRNNLSRTRGARSTIAPSRTSRRTLCLPNALQPPFTGDGAS